MGRDSRKSCVGSTDGRTIISRSSGIVRSEEHTSELQSRFDLVCRLPPRVTLFPYTTLFRSLSRWTSSRYAAPDRRVRSREFCKDHGPVREQRIRTLPGSWGEIPGNPALVQPMAER